MSVKIQREGNAIRIRTDRAGERAVSDLIDEAEFEAAVAALGYVLSAATDPPEPEAAE